jgi:hypothetical protein
MIDAPLMDDDQRQPAPLFERVYGLIFLTIFLAAIGGGVCVFGGQEAVAMENTPRYDRHNDISAFQIFHVPGLRDWRVQLAIGATIGAACGVGYSIRHWRDKY